MILYQARLTLCHQAVLYQARLTLCQEKRRTSQMILATWVQNDKLSSFITHFILIKL